MLYEYNRHHFSERFGRSKCVMFSKNHFAREELMQNLEKKRMKVSDKEDTTILKKLGRKREELLKKENDQPRTCTVQLKCKLPSSRETHRVSLETHLVSLETCLVSFESFLVSRECTASTSVIIV